MAGCGCSEREIIGADGKSIKNYYELLTPVAGATTAGKTIVAGPIAIDGAFEICNGNGVIRSFSVKEFVTGLKLDLDAVFFCLQPPTKTTDTSTSISSSSGVLDSIGVVEADYKDKTDYWEARASVVNPLKVFNKATADADSRKLWFYLVARGAKTYTSGTRLLVQITIERE